VILIAYASNHGQTAKIAGALARELRREGKEVEIFDLRESSPDPGRYEAVIAGGSLHGGRHQGQLVTWVKANLDALSQIPTAFYSVSLTASEDTDQARAETQACIDRFTSDSGWTPTVTRALPGALLYSRYGLFMRLVMRMIVRRRGHSLDPSHDHELTDWDDVSRWGNELATLLDTPAQPRRAA
jgi:menaquinone-dependent protoporphyrinogen oxidase